MHITASCSKNIDSGVILGPTGKMLSIVCTCLDCMTGLHKCQAHPQDTDPEVPTEKALVEGQRKKAVSRLWSSGLGLVLRDFIFSLAGELSSSEVKPSEVLTENLISLIALSFSSTVMQRLGSQGKGCSQTGFFPLQRASLAEQVSWLDLTDPCPELGIDKRIF